MAEVVDTAGTSTSGVMLDRKDEEFLKTHLSDYSEDSGYAMGFFEGDLDDFLRRFMAISSTCFVRAEVHSKEKGHKRYSASARPIWEHNSGRIPIKFCGAPFEIAGSQTWHCQHGSVKDSRGGIKKESLSGDDLQGKRQKKPRVSLKMGCPAVIHVRTVNMFPNHTIDISNCLTQNSIRSKKLKAMQEWKNEGETSLEQSHTVCRYYIKVPLALSHTGHPVGSQADCITQKVDKKVIEKIYDLVGRNIAGTSDVQGMLADYVENELFREVPSEQKPKHISRQFYPSKRDVKNHVFRARLAQKYCKKDQELLSEKVADWQRNSPESGYFYRASSIPNTDNEVQREMKGESEEQTLLFVHQEPWQKRLLARYGSQLVLMDAVHKATKYSLPLYFLLVNTNMGYKVVAEFITQSENQQLISQAIRTIKLWNPSWCPSYLMVDNSQDEINALEEQFPEATVYICDFHRQRDWQRWAGTAKNELKVAEQDELLCFLTAVADARTQDAVNEAVVELRESSLYKQKTHVQKFVEEWLLCAFRWARAVRDQDAENIVNTGNGVEEQKGVFNYHYLPYTLDKSIYGIALMLVETFIPETHRSYVEMNVKLSSQSQVYNPLVPSYLHHRPPNFVKHCLRSQFRAEGEFSDTDVVCVNTFKGEFNVRSSNSSNEFEFVQFHVPRCTCDEWEAFRFPCMHFHAVFYFLEDWPFERLPVSYRNSVFLTLDKQVVPAASSSSLHHTTHFNHHDYASPTYSRTQVIPQTVSWNQTDKHGSSETFQTEARNLSASSTSNICKLRRLLQEEVKSLDELTRLVNDAETLQSALERVRELCSNMERVCPVESRLQQSPVKKKRLKLTPAKDHKASDKSEPLSNSRQASVVDMNSTGAIHLAVEQIVQNGDSREIASMDSTPVLTNGTSSTLLNSSNDQVTPGTQTELLAHSSTATLPLTASSMELSVQGTEEVSTLDDLTGQEAMDSDSVSLVHFPTEQLVQEVVMGDSGENNTYRHVIPMSTDVDDSNPLHNGPSPYTRLRMATYWKLALRDTMLKFGPYSLTPGDLWTLLRPSQLCDKDRRSIKAVLPDFTPGWFTHSVINSFLWKCQLTNRKLFAVNSSFYPLVKSGVNPRHLLQGERLTNVEMILIPMNINKKHWTLLALDKCNKEKLYFDPFVSVERLITTETHKQLMADIQKICEVVDVKLQWNSSSWPCREPQHYKQEDSCNCGVMICLFARFLEERISLASDFSLAEERQRIASSIFGSCYNDLDRRNTEVCKVCREGEGDQWLICDACGQHFHAVCLKQDYYLASTEPFFTCPW